MVFEQQDSLYLGGRVGHFTESMNLCIIFVVSVVIELSTCIVNPQIDGQKSWWFGETVL